MNRLEKLYELIDSNNASDIVILDVGEISGFTEYFIIATATSTPHLKQLKSEIPMEMKKEFSEPPFGVEGMPESHWIVLDYGDIVVHVFTEEKRKFYDLEKIWGQCEKVTFED